MKEIILDCMGDACPAIVIKIEKKITQLNVGEKLVVQCNHVCAPKNVSDWARKHGHHYECLEVNYGAWEITIEKIK